MYNTQIDVAKIMSEIKAKAAERNHVRTVTSDHESTGRSTPELDAVRNELDRIQTYIVNTNSHSEGYARIGERIRISPKSRGLIRKIKIFFKRLVRKSTRFLAEDQISVNLNTIDCIRALSEYNTAYLPILDAVSGLVNDNAELRKELHELSEKLDESEAQYRAAISSINDMKKQMENSARIENQMAELTDSLAGYERKNSELLQDLRSDNSSFVNKLKSIEQGTDILNDRVRGFESKINSFEATLKNSSESVSDEIYEQFLNEFRGSESEIYSHFNQYFGENSALNPDPAMNVVDLGCGRGEFLDYISRFGCRAIGVDTNKIFVEHCRSNGHEAVHTDALSYLHKAPDSSVDLITAFQLIEHISLRDLEDLIREAYRVLKPGGRLLLETPNSQNVEVGSFSFYVDPTHKRPVNQNYVQFLCRILGYSSSEVFLWKEKEILNWMDSVYADDKTNTLDSSTIRMILNQMKQVMFTSPDYAVIAQK